MNGQQMTISGKEFSKGGIVNMAGKVYEVYNTMPGLGLVAMCRLGKNGKQTRDHVSLSVEQIETLIKINVIS